MTLFRPCIDLHQGQVKQIVGKSLELGGGEPLTNFIAAAPAEHYAELYRADGMRGGHLIKLGPGNDEAACRALRAWPSGLQLGGGVTPDNARFWLEQGASKVIVTSFLFEAGELSRARLERLAAVVSRDELIIDLSCRRVAGEFFVVAERWTSTTSTRLDAALFHQLAGFAGEFLVHAVDVEGERSGIDEELVQKLAGDCDGPCTYAGGGRSIDDLERVRELSDGRIDLTFGSALDLFGGSGVRYRDCVAYNQRQMNRFQTH